MKVEPIEAVTVVDTTPEAAFRAFVEGIGNWWPLATHSVTNAKFGRPAAGLEIEPGPGGRIIERGPDGAVHVWGRVTRWEEFGLLEFSWHVGRDPALATSVSVRFAPTDDGRTGVTLIHADWDVLGEAGRVVRDRNANGWPVLIGELFAAYVRQTCRPAPPSS